MIYVLHKDPAIHDEKIDHLLPSCYYGGNGSLISELQYLLPHSVPIFKNDNGEVYMKIEKTARGTSIESTIKSFSRHKDGRGTFQDLISNHASEVKHRSISRNKLNLLQNIKWNGLFHP